MAPLKGCSGAHADACPLTMSTCLTMCPTERDTENNARARHTQSK